MASQIPLMSKLPLSVIKKPTRVTVEEVEGSAAVRLMEMGITPGTELEVIRTAPLESPVEIKVRGHLLSLRDAEASCILVEKEE